MIRNKKEFEQVFLGPKWGYDTEIATSSDIPHYTTKLIFCDLVVDIRLF